MNYAGIGRRLIAAIVDGSITFLGFGFAIAALTNRGSIGPDGAEFNLEGGAAVALFALMLAYFVSMEAMLGATLGKYLLGLRVRALDGSPMSWAAAILRNVIRPIDTGLSLVSAILIWVLPRHQRLGDLAAGTVVLRTSANPACVDSFARATRSRTVAVTR
jgi:uncharacterized RDD family membrane protein YckC